MRDNAPRPDIPSTWKLAVPGFTSRDFSRAQSAELQYLLGIDTDLVLQAMRKMDISMTDIRPIMARIARGDQDTADRIRQRARELQVRN